MPFEMDIAIFMLAKDVLERDGSLSPLPPTTSGYASECHSIIEGKRDNDVGQSILVEWIIWRATGRVRSRYPVINRLQQRANH